MTACTLIFLDYLRSTVTFLQAPTRRAEVAPLHAPHPDLPDPPLRGGRVPGGPTQGRASGPPSLRGQALVEPGGSHFVEYRILIFSVLHRPNGISRHLFGEREDKRQLCRVLVNGSTWRGPLGGGDPQPVPFIEGSGGADPAQLLPWERMGGEGGRLVSGAPSPWGGGYPTVNLEEDAPVYRPLRGPLRGSSGGHRVRYLPAADGMSRSIELWIHPARMEDDVPEVEAPSVPDRFGDLGGTNGGAPGGRRPLRATVRFSRAYEERVRFLPGP